MSTALARRAQGPRATARPDQAVLVAVHDSLHPAPQPELIQHPADVRLDCGLGQEELRGDLGTRQAPATSMRISRSREVSPSCPAGAGKAELPACGRCGTNLSSSLRVTRVATAASPLATPGGATRTSWRPSEGGDHLSALAAAQCTNDRGLAMTSNGQAHQQVAHWRKYLSRELGRADADA
jgi:hypothetical protein